ncbi:hypothetical protein L6452_44435 [Arctium lappa]|uniref:Uncharacterized protein n=1 Tax=Arctium lappa TaxID=4217 RepID=A0ACB8XGU4_ARCLA|nr:hypothetical protein L6452_44435 [Arctium lappa]
MAFTLPSPATAAARRRLFLIASTSTLPSPATQLPQFIMLVDFDYNSPWLVDFRKDRVSLVLFVAACMAKMKAMLIEMVRHIGTAFAFAAFFRMVYTRELVHRNLLEMMRCHGSRKG